MAEIHIAATAAQQVRCGDVLQIIVPVRIARGDVLVVHVATSHQPVVHAVRAKPLGVHDPRTGLPS